MEKRIIVSTVEFEKVPLNWVRIYAELLAKEIPKFSKQFQNDDAYRIFFPQKTFTNLDLETKRRIQFFRTGIIFAMHKTFGTKIPIEDLVLIFRYKNSDTLRAHLCYAKKTNLSLAMFLCKKLKTIIADPESSHVRFLTIPKGYTLITVLITGKEARMLVPNEYLEFSERLYRAISDESSGELSKEVVCSRNRKREIVTARTVFITVFIRKYPDATTKFFAYLLGYKNHTTVGNLYRNISHFLDPVTKNSSDSKEFMGLVNKIKSRCEVL